MIRFAVYFTDPPRLVAAHAFDYEFKVVCVFACVCVCVCVCVCFCVLKFDQVHAVVSQDFVVETVLHGRTDFKLFAALLGEVAEQHAHYK